MRFLPLLALAATFAFAAPAAGQATQPVAIPWPMDYAPAAPGVFAFDHPAPAGKDGPIVVRDGHFHSGPDRVRFWGVNLCFAANFPTHDQADTLATRLARFGFNAVRFHHMDHQPFPVGIFADKNLDKLSPEALDRLDYFIAALKKAGIYADLNLHVSRGWTQAHGLPGTETVDAYDKIVDIFAPELIAANQQYARDLLTHVNPYTKTRYADEPAVAMVEINNEDTLFLWGADEKLERLPEPYAGELKKQWNAWLLKKYAAREKLQQAWNKDAQPVGEFMVLPFKAGQNGGWNLEVHDQAKAAFRVAEFPITGPGTFLKGTYLAGVTVVSAKGDQSWHVQLTHGGLKLKKGRFYTVEIAATSAAPATIGVAVGQSAAPWQSLGLATSFAAKPDDESNRRFGFIATADEPNARLQLHLGGTATTYTVRDVLVTEGGQVGLRDGEDPAHNTVPIHKRGDPVSPSRADDWYDFLQQTDEAYFVAMRDFLKKDLGVKAPVTGTIGLGALGTLSQSKMDFVDAHAYWDHPQFPRKGWDAKDWLIDNNAMVNRPDRAPLFHLAVTRVHGKPFTVTEYNHSAPNEFAAECIPMVASFASTQDWDGIFLFAYTHNTKYQKDKIDGFFDIEGNPLKIAFAPLGARIFRDQLFPPGFNPRAYVLPRAELLQSAPRYNNHLYGLLRDQYKFAWQDALQSPVAIAFEPVIPPPAVSGIPGTELTWEVAGNNPALGQYTATAHQAAVFVGTFTPNKPVELGSIIPHVPVDMGPITLQSAYADFAAFMATPIKPGVNHTLLLALAGKGENPGMVWTSDHRSVNDQWGKGPALIQVPRVQLRLPGHQLRLVKPDGTQGDLVTPNKDGWFDLAKTPSLWYLATPDKPLP